MAACEEGGTTKPQFRDCCRSLGPSSFHIACLSPSIKGWAWCHRPIPVLTRQTALFELKANLVYISNSRAARATQ